MGNRRFRLVARRYLKGMNFGVGAWLTMMIAVVPMAGAGFFGISFGVMTLVPHIIFGLVLGSVYGAARVIRKHSTLTS